MFKIRMVSKQKFNMRFKKDIKQIGIVTIGGVLLVLGLFWLGNSTDLFGGNFYKSAIFNDRKKNDLERKVSAYENGSNNPERFTLLGVEIAAAQSSGLIQKSSANYFIQRLEDAYKKHVFEESEQYLSFIYVDKTKYINNLVDLRESVGNSPEIKLYLDQINQTHFYLHVWPPRVEKFLDERESILVSYWENLHWSLWPFPEDDVESIRYRLINTQGLDPKYKHSKIRAINEKNLKRLNDFENYYKRYQIDHSIKNNW